MSDYNPVKDLGLTCPYGGIFYICADDPERFIGCCTINPCGARKGLCPDKSLRPASFNATLQHEFLPQACINDNIDVSWYNCVGEALPFLGCCAVDPCLRGVCPQSDLRAAKLSDKVKNAQEFLDGGPEYMPRPRSSALDQGLGVSSSSLCASSTTAMTTMVSSFITSFTMETTVATIISPITMLTSTTTISPREASDAPPQGPKEHGSNRELRWLWLILLVLIVVLLYLAKHFWENPCCLEWRKERSKVKFEQRHEQEHRHEQQQQQEHEHNKNTPTYPETDQMITEDNFRYIRGRSSRNNPRTTHERPQNSQSQQNDPPIKDGRSGDNKEIRSLDLQSKSNQQASYASVRRTAPNRKPLPGTNNQTSQR
ncbi:hypothetical protein H9Q69_005599 [Fusarium xylarioides]|uniref:Uncharacterized protein n=1 Tax=Fusarium xylarioides TaxID=221167 RepID=A0A9P7LPN4_9HYPO|nr:hypothetical protein H9Q70_006390 [Fusarium xylarioides]KAG5774378.1 hypothetical protein H9Q72_000266 [Fusarium xylarioides]KAG5786021.1 hypothetical protein H9Q73_000321 [Fusarium xylarioides]KAG5795349.1 hypothetical protein H9Q69_005599 [Fusarium xylarioides]KAG5813057.1 hypothetical protein H9Q71_004005 [Fusarium xylarioides]